MGSHRRGVEKLHFEAVVRKLKKRLRRLSLSYLQNYHENFEKKGHNAKPKFEHWEAKVLIWDWSNAPPEPPIGYRAPRLEQNKLEIPYKYWIYGHPPYGTKWAGESFTSLEENDKQKAVRKARERYWEAVEAVNQRNNILINNEKRRVEVSTKSFNDLTEAWKEKRKAFMKSLGKKPHMPKDLRIEHGEAFEVALKEVIAEKRKEDRLRSVAAKTTEDVRRQADEKKANLKRTERCPYCNGHLGWDTHLDHIYPVSKGGKSTIENLVHVCESCNLNKGDNTLAMFIKKMKFDRDQIEARLEQLDKEF